MSARGLTHTARFWAGVDFVATGALILPTVASGVLQLLFTLSGEPRPSFESIHFFFVTLAGLLGVVWASARWLEPIPPLVQIDVIGRTIVGAVILLFAFQAGLPKALLAFVLSEWGGAAHQFIVLRRERSAQLD